MTADLVARLEAYIAVREAMRGMDEVVHTCHSSGGSASISITDLREAASALRSSGEAVACTVNGYLPRQRAVELRLDCDVPEWITKNPGIRAYLSATPASAWRPISTVPRDGTRVVVWMPEGIPSAASYGPASEPQATHWMPITPPTSTKGG